jgi:hypothetical protein
MAKRRQEDIAEDLEAVLEFVRQHADGVRSGEIAAALKKIPQRSLQRRLKTLVGEGRLTQEGKGPAARYRLSVAAAEAKKEEAPARATTLQEEKPEEAVIPLSPASEKIRAYVTLVQNSILCELSG